MKVAIMQPYFLPYLGYFQLIAAVDKFVLLDDVNYINRGWINRNQISLLGQPIWLTLPLSAASQNRLIRDIDIFADDGWQDRHAKLVSQAFGKAPHGPAAIEMYRRWLGRAEGNLSVFLHAALCDICCYLGIDTEIVPSSSIYAKDSLKAHHRILDICLREGASQYINPPGGVELYDKDFFARAGIELVFFKPELYSSTLHSGGRDGGVFSILEMIAYNSRALIQRCLQVNSAGSMRDNQII
ncbi:MAG: hypothetical protein V7642_6713 [Burkholderiales bacterium]|jgi:hypothetical protein